jgi:hypothetical protein
VIRFAERISLDVSPDTFTFANANATVTATLGTYVYVDETAADLRVLAVGEIVPDTTGLVRVDAVLRRALEMGGAMEVRFQ